jgi:hypothetical protein
MFWLSQRGAVVVVGAMLLFTEACDGPSAASNERVGDEAVAASVASSVASVVAPAVSSVAQPPALAKPKARRNELGHEEVARSDAFLASISPPPNWVRSSTSSLSFTKVESRGNGSTSYAVLFTAVELDLTLEEVIAAATARKATLQRLTIDGQPAVRLPDPKYDRLYVKNPRGDLLTFDFAERSTETERAQVIASMRFFTIPGPGRALRVSGTVGRHTGNCMPPRPCPRQLVSRELQFRKRAKGGASGAVVATVVSDASGSYAVTLPRGNYVVTVQGEGDGAKGFSPPGPRVLDQLRVLEQDVALDMTINDAAW